MAKRKTLMDEIHEELRGNRELNTRYQRELTRLQLANQILRLREEGELSQAQLARKIGTHQSAIARMEQSTYRGYTVATLAKIAAAAGARLEVRFVPSGRRVQHAR
jgi:transcriptional regulator with XRE-family HTH domain